MQAGKLRTKVTFQQSTEVSDGQGGSTVSWGDDLVVPCEYRGQSGRESVDSGQIESTSRAVLMCRTKAVSSINASWRAVIDGENWDIHSITKFGQRNQRTDIVIEKGRAV